VNKINHIIKKKVFFKKAYKWISIFLFIVFLICLSLKCCDYQSIISNENNQQSNENTTIISDTQNGRRGNIKLPPDELIRVNPIDSSKIKEVINDPIGRNAINDLLNIYLKENVDIEEYVIDLEKQLVYDSIQTNYFAVAYKRLQIKVNEERKDEIKNIIKLDTINVKFVTNEWIYSKTSKESDPDFKNLNNSWFYQQIGVFDAWTITKGNPDIKIAVIDDGFDLKHKELSNKFVDPWNVFDYNDNVYAKPKVQLHGTHVAGTIIAEANNNFGIAGVAPDCNFIPIQISNESGIITTSSLLDGIFYALKNEANIINLSIGFSLGSKATALSIKEQEYVEKNEFLDEEELWDEVFKIALEEGVIIVQAAGNDNVIAGIDPMKRSNNSIVVGASNNLGNKADFTNYGGKVSVYAPGTKIYSSLPNDEMGYLDGTSMATPIIAGCVALMRANDSTINASEVIKLFSSQNEKGMPFNIYELLMNHSL
jgi:subtilisin family serine protease